MEQGDRVVHHYFVDEAGDTTLFDRNGRIIVGQPGASRLFMVGAAHVPDPEGAHAILEELRAKIRASPYFRNVPSMDPLRKKTAICFHACKDLPEVRFQVFEALARIAPNVTIALRRKDTLAQFAQRMYRRSGVKLRSDAMYNNLVTEVFTDLLHQADENRIIFARRGKSTQARHLSYALTEARARTEILQGIACNQPTKIQASYPSESTGLQIVDYYLWAVQRLYERGEDRFFRFVASHFVKVKDLDDQRNCAEGECYCGENPLAVEKIMPLPS